MNEYGNIVLDSVFKYFFKWIFYKMLGIFKKQKQVVHLPFPSKGIFPDFKDNDPRIIFNEKVNHYVVEFSFDIRNFTRAKMIINSMEIEFQIPGGGELSEYNKFLHITSSYGDDKTIRVSKFLNPYEVDKIKRLKSEDSNTFPMDLKISLFCTYSNDLIIISGILKQKFDIRVF